MTESCKKQRVQIVGKATLSLDIGSSKEEVLGEYNQKFHYLSKGVLMVPLSLVGNGCSEA